MIIAALLLILAGLFFFFTATLGLLRLPDVYCRMHATGKGDTLGALLVLAGIAVFTLQQGMSPAALLTAVKIMLIALFLFLANPTATYSIARAALDAGVEPLERRPPEP